MKSTRRNFLKGGFAGVAYVTLGASRAESADPVLGKRSPRACHSRDQVVMEPDEPV